MGQAYWQVWAGNAMQGRVMQSDAYLHFIGVDSAAACMHIHPILLCWQGKACDPHAESGAREASSRTGGGRLSPEVSKSMQACSHQAHAEQAQDNCVYPDMYTSCQMF